MGSWGEWKIHKIALIDLNSSSTLGKWPKTNSERFLRCQRSQQTWRQAGPPARCTARAWPQCKCWAHPAAFWGARRERVGTSQTCKIVFLRSKWDSSIAALAKRSDGGEWRHVKESFRTCVGMECKRDITGMVVNPRTQTVEGSGGKSPGPPDVDKFQMKRGFYLAKHRIAKGNYFHPFHRQKRFFQ